MKKYHFGITLFILLFCRNAEAQKVVLSNGFQNIFYIGIDNPVEVAVSNYACDSVTLEIDNGSIKGTNCEYTVKVEKEGNTTISVYANKDNIRSLLQKISFTAVMLPKPVAKICGMENSDIKSSVFKAQRGICAELQDLDTDLKYDIVSYKVLILKNNGKVKMYKITGPYFSEEMREEMLAIFQEDMIIFYDIISKSSDGKEIPLTPLVYNIRTNPKF
ncbi:MAG: gldM [Bacteroidota bacterium]|nr:gldM [Bacteroidota bacterium]